MEVVCPSCAFTVQALALAGAPACPRCGCNLAAAIADPCDSDPALAKLSVELREAFGAGAVTLHPPRVMRTAADVTLSIRSSGVADPADVAGTRLGDFELLETIGHGGMGIVYRARQRSLDREVALKVLPPFARRQRASVARFRRESQAAARLHHTNIVPIYAQGEYDDKFYYAMELIDGESLDCALRDDSSACSLTLRRPPSRGTTPSAFAGRSGENAGSETRPDITAIRRGREDFRRIAHLVAEVADALEHAHKNGVIHRDIKPQNLLLGRDDRLHITDFGLAHLLDQPHLTVPGEIMGTPAYMSPEQVGGGGDTIDPRTDIYSLGVTLYELLTLRRPFEGPSREQIIHRITASEPRAPRLLDPRIPRDMETICLHAIEKAPSSRYPSAEFMAADLRRFADERPILTRRVGPVAKGVKWVRRHKAASAAIGASAAVLVLAIALGASLAASRGREANRLTHSAYDQLVYRDYRRPEGVAVDLDGAERLGGDAGRIARLRALAAMLNAKPDVPIGHLSLALAMDAEDMEALYLLAWAQNLAGRKQEAAVSFERAEAAGGARTPAEWFFRGTAIHFGQPTEAIESYKRARELRRTLDHDFFPQATLDLARARNQLMYRTRSIDAFIESETALRELIDNKYYGSYPYYLLSIAHRLAAEVYEQSGGTRADRADYHYRQALHWALEGQKQTDGRVERAVTAEAECHESMGDYAAALDARTRAIALAEQDRTRCEGYHYRWRLHYWRDELDEALDDLKAHQQCAPEIPFHGHLYPMLVHAEAGRMDEALRLARSIAEAAPQDAQALIWSATCLRILGQRDEAQALLDVAGPTPSFSSALVTPQTEAWVEALFEFVAGRTDLADLLQKAGDVDSYWKLTAEAYFHAAAIKLADANRAGARQDIEQSFRSFDDQTRYTFHAQIFRINWRSDLSWPSWLPVANTENSTDSGRQQGEMTLCRRYNRRLWESGT